MVVLLPPHTASSLVWRLALALLYEWMGVALVTSSDAVITVLVDKRWRAVHAGWFGVKHNWVLPPPGKDNAGRKGEEKRERATAATVYSPARTKLLARDSVRRGTKR